MSIPFAIMYKKNIYKKRSKKTVSSVLFFFFYQSGLFSSSGGCDELKGSIGTSPVSQLCMCKEQTVLRKVKEKVKE